jgi:uncharacterized protein
VTKSEKKKSQKTKRTNQTNNGMSKNALIVFVKNGSNVKTRIAQETDADTAMAVYAALVNQCVALCSSLYDIDVLVYYSPMISENDLWNNVAKAKHLQSEGDLGSRMKSAFEETLDKYDKAVIIGSDCPYITKDHLFMAFESLDKADIAIGPAFDGGYYLLGMHTLIPQLFESIKWSTDTVYYDTIDVLFSQRKSVQILERLNDVDHYTDYLEWKKGL